MQTTARMHADSERVTPHEASTLSEFLSSRAKRVGYEPAWRSWAEYCQGVERHVRPSLFMKELTPQEKAIRLGKYVQSLYEDQGLRGDQIRIKMTNLKMVFLEALEDTLCFESSLVSRAKKAAGLSIQEREVRHEMRQEQQSLPVSMDIIWPIRDEYWAKSSWLCPGMDRRAIWLGIALGFDSGPRVSNVTRKDGQKTDHCIRAHDVSIFLLIEGLVSSTKGGEPFRLAVCNLPDVHSCVSKIEYRFRTGKYAMPWSFHTLARRTPRESTLLDDLVSWLIYSRVQSNDELFTRYPGPGDMVNKGRRSLTRRDYQSGLTWAAEHAGLPSSSLKTSASRRGCAETVRASGGSHAEICHGRWTENSFIPFRHYLAKPEELLQPTGAEGSLGSFARSTTKESSTFNLAHVKSIAMARGVLRCNPDEGSPH